MDFTTDREALLAELNLFAGVVENRPSDPLSMFSNVTFRPSENGCELTASGGEIGLRSSIAAQTSGEGLLSVPVSLLARWLKEGRDEKVSFHETDQHWDPGPLWRERHAHSGSGRGPADALGAARGRPLRRAIGDVCDPAAIRFLRLPGRGGRLGRDGRSADRSGGEQRANRVLRPLPPGLLKRHSG